jgi:hypothetical protein
MPLELNCQECRDAIHERSLTGVKNGLELSMSLPREVQLHLEICGDCREVCTQSLALESKLVQLAHPLDAPDMRGLVMQRIRQGERASLPVVVSGKPIGGGREMVWVMLALTLAVYWTLPILPEIPEWSTFASMSWFVVPELNLDFSFSLPSFGAWEIPMLVATALICVQQTGRWWSQSRA